ncbi:coiled-coil domain-containing protein 110 [Amia ocellicauda]|uniref:coiled-coil domain-containing protein 110 n=1 Tax=Amia ocellicauda TaxID=2972642 RepID=UPI0034646A14
METEQWSSDPIQGLGEQQTQAHSALEELQLQIEAFDSLKRKALQSIPTNYKLLQSTVCNSNTYVATTSETIRLSQCLNNLLSQLNQNLSETNHFKSSLQAYGKLGSGAIHTWQKNRASSLLRMNLMESPNIPTLVSSELTSTLKSEYPTPPPNCRIEGLAEQKDCTDELWKMLDSISEAGNRLRDELERSHQREVHLTCKLNEVWKQAQAQTPVETESQAAETSGFLPKMVVRKNKCKMEDGELRRILELEAQVDRLQNATLSLEEANLKLHKTYELQEKPEIHMQTHATTQAVFWASPRQNDHLNFKQDNGNEQEYFNPRMLQSKEETMSEIGNFLENENKVLRNILKDKEKLISHIERSTLEKTLSEDKLHRDAIKIFEKRLQMKDVEIQQNLQLLTEKEQELDEVRSQTEMKDTEIRSLEKMLKQEKKQNQETIANLEKACNSLKYSLLKAKIDQETVVKKLKHLLEKYAMVKKHARSANAQSLQNIAEKEHIMKLLDAAKQEKEKVCTEQGLLKEEKESALIALTDVKQEMSRMKQDCYRNLEDKERLQKVVSRMKDENITLQKELQDAQQEIQRVMDLMSIQKVEKESYMKELEESKKTIEKLQIKMDEYISEKECTSLQMLAMKRDADIIQNKLQQEIQQLQQEKNATEQAAKDLRRESEALTKLVADLKEDKCMLRRELDEVGQEKASLEAKSQNLHQVGDKLKDVFSVLQKERNALLAELCDLRKDYLNLSDRITERMNEICQEDSHMSIQELKLSGEDLIKQRNTQQREESEEVINQIKKRLEEEKKTVSRVTVSGPISSYGACEQKEVLRRSTQFHDTSSRGPLSYGTENGSNVSFSRI